MRAVEGKWFIVKVHERGHSEKVEYRVEQEKWDRRFGLPECPPS